MFEELKKGVSLNDCFVRGLLKIKIGNVEYSVQSDKYILTTFGVYDKFNARVDIKYLTVIFVDYVNEFLRNKSICVYDKNTIEKSYEILDTYLIKVLLNIVMEYLYDKKIAILL